MKANIKKGLRLAKPRLNIFYIISVVCIFILIGYLWLVFLPTLWGALEYESIKLIVIMITLLLFVAAVLILITMMMKK